MASAEDVQKMMESISKIINDGLAAKEKELEPLMNKAKENLAEELKQKFEKDLEEHKRQLEENYQVQLKRQTEEIKTDLFKHFEEKLKNIEELKTKLQSQVDDIREMFFTLQSENFQSHNQLSSHQEQSITINVPPPATTAASNLERPGLETEGTYENWAFSNGKVFHLIPMSELKKILTQLENLNVTVKAQKADGLALTSQLISMSKSITVTINRRFPPNGEYYYCGFWVNDLHEIIDSIDKDCVSVNYSTSKNIIFNKFKQMGNIEGWTEAYNFAGYHYLLDITTLQSRLDKYLWLLCCLVNIEKNCKVNEFEVFNVFTFEKEYDLTWKVEQ